LTDIVRVDGGGRDRMEEKNELGIRGCRGEQIK
jgi:hypothetical protein